MPKIKKFVLADRQKRKSAAVNSDEKERPLTSWTSTQKNVRLLIRLSKQDT